MTFSIRNLLALVAVAALGMVAWRSHQDAQREQDRLSTLRRQTAIKSAEQNLFSDNPLLHQAMRNTRDEYEAIRKLRIQCDAGIELLREKYGRIEPSGPGIVSIRALPSIRGDTGKPPVAFRIYVPEERKVWIKYGVRDSKSRSVAANSEFEPAILHQVPFDHDGPYEIRLTPGQHVLSMTIGDTDAGSLPFRINLDASVLVDSRLNSASHTGGGSTYAPLQLDFKNSNLAKSGLMSAKMTLRGDAKNESPKSYQFLVWLSDESSGYSAFPGSQ